MRGRQGRTGGGAKRVAVDGARPAAPSSVFAGALWGCAAGAQKPDARRGHGLPSADTARQKTLRPAQTDPGTGVRDHQIGDGIPSVPAARARQCPRRVEPRYNGLEHEENVCAQHRLSLPPNRLANSVRRRAEAKTAAILIYAGTTARVAAELTTSRKSKPESDRLLGPRY